MEVGPHEVRARFAVASRWPVRAVALGVFVVAAVVLGMALTRQLYPPGIYRPSWSDDVLLEGWCSRGTLVARPPYAACALDAGVVGRDGRRLLDQASFVRYRNRQPKRWPRPRPPHPAWAFAGLMLAGLGLWRWARAVQVRVRVNGVWVGSRFVQADAVRACRVGFFFDRPYLELRTTEGVLRTPPLARPGWEVEDLCAEIRALAPRGFEVVEAERAEAEVGPRMRALTRLRAGDPS